MVGCIVTLIDNFVIMEAGAVKKFLADNEMVIEFALTKRIVMVR